MVLVLARIAVTVLLIGLAGWLVPYSLKERVVERGRVETLLAGDPNAYRGFPRVQVLFGDQAFVEGRLEEAERFYARAIEGNVVQVEAWLKLAEAAAAKGKPERAREVLRFVAELTPEVLRWKWEQALLARDLGMMDLLDESVNALIRENRKVNDALWMMEADAGGTGSMLERLWPENREPYLRWLMRWGRGDDALLVWEAMEEEARADEELKLSFIHFLIGNKKTAAAQDLWRPMADPGGVTNPGFERPVTGRGFDWRFSDREGAWRIRETGSTVHSGSGAVEVRFSGEVNSNFWHLYQFVPVKGGERYRLAFWWKSQQLTTDQGPFVEVLGKDCKGLVQKGPMILGTVDWQEVPIEFEVPEGCDTAIIRVRRQESRRFDSRIDGTLWMDDFVLKHLGN